MANSSLDNIACVSITTHNHGLFYLQQKDENYPIPVYRMKYTFFGGSSEKNEHPDKTIVRELNEELMPEAVNLIVPHLIRLFRIKLLRAYLLPKKEYCLIHLYESRLSKKNIRELEKYTVKEGKCGVIFPSHKFSKLLFPESLHTLIDRYKQFL